MPNVSDLKEAIAATIGGVFALAAAFLTWWLSKKPDSIERFERVPGARAQCIVGTWRGKLTQPDYPGGPVDVDFAGRLHLRRGRIVGSLSASVQFEQGKHKTGEKILFEVDVQGGFYSDSLVKLDYKNKNNSVLQFGALVLILDARGTRMKGRLVGYGSYAESVVHGIADISRESA